MTEPSSEDVDAYGYTWDPASYGGDSIEASFPSFQWPVQRTSPLPHLGPLRSERQTC
ncbi:hypothetical protein IMZ48_34605 [Candidatus Bathyarchaeota archaeon]|nr:hypothetical protein [Candidatus Bathyarchaeota archaeon]